MTIPPLSTLLATESDRIEWKESARDAAGLLSTVSALANDLGDTRRVGYLVIGVRKDGSVIGLETTGGSLDKEQQAISNRIHSTKIQPVPSVSIESRVEGDRAVLVLEIAPANVPPVVAVDGVAYVRVGTTTRRATDADLSRLRERRPENQRPFDSRPARGADASDLRLSFLKDEYDASRAADPSSETYPEFEQWLGSKKQLGQIFEGRWTPNYGALLLYGVSPQTIVPGAIVEFVRYAGTDELESPVALRKTVTGSLSDQLDALWLLISTSITSREMEPEGIRTELRPDYPLEALKELARNLVQHRLYEGTHAPGRVAWFDDRVEFSNPGGPFGRASEGEFGTHSDYRNPLVTSGLVADGYVQQLGRGVRLARRELEKNGNPPLEVETDGFTRVVVRRRP